MKPKTHEIVDFFGVVTVFPALIRSLSLTAAVVLARPALYLLLTTPVVSFFFQDIAKALLAMCTMFSNGSYLFYFFFQLQYDFL